MRPFEYFAPNSLDEAVSLLTRCNGKAKIIAGGTDLLVEIKEHLRKPDYIVNINKIPGLRDFYYNDTDGLKIGCLTKVRTVEQSQMIKDKYPGLYQAASQLGSIQVRNSATVAGNICRASPSADTITPLIAAGARVTIWGPMGERTVLLENFFKGPGKTILKSEEILTNILVPPPASNTGRVYLKHGRRKSMELATVGVAVSVTLEGEKCSDVKVVLGAVAATPIRSEGAEAVLEGQSLAKAHITDAALAAMEDASPISDIRASANYRKQMVKVLTEQALEEALEKAKSNTL